MKILNIILVLLFPILVLADGVKISYYNLDAVKVALVVKLLLYDSKRNAAKVEVLKKITRKETNKTQITPTISLPDTEVKASDSEDSFTNEIDIKEGKTALLQIWKPPQPVPRRWVEQEMYWNNMRDPSVGSKYILVYQNGEYEFSPYSKEYENKFDILLDDDKAQKKVADSSVEQLKELVIDQDYESKVLPGLAKRKVIDGKFLMALAKMEDRSRLASRYSRLLDNADRELFWADYANESAKGNSESQKNFLQQFFYYSEIKSLDARVKIYEKFSQADKEVRYQTHIVLRDLKDGAKNSPGRFYSRIRNLYLENLKHAPHDLPSISLSDFFHHLPKEERPDFLQKVVDLYVPYSEKSGSLGPFEPLADEIESVKDLKAAWKMMEVPLKDNDRKEKIFNAVLSTIFAKDSLHDPSVKERIFKYVDLHVNEATYPIEMSPEVKAKYNSLGGVRYQDLDMIRLTHQDNSDELAKYFTRYYEKALTVHLIEINQKKGKSAIKLKVEKNSGRFKTEESKSSGYKVHSICKKAIPGETITLAIDDESLGTLKKTNFKKMILATRSDDYKFVILDTKYGAQIEELLQAEGSKK